MAGSYMDKYGVVLDLPVALIEIFFNLEKIEKYLLRKTIYELCFILNKFVFFSNTR